MSAERWITWHGSTLTFTKEWEFRASDQDKTEILRHVRDMSAILFKVLPVSGHPARKLVEVQYEDGEGELKPICVLMAKQLPLGYYDPAIYSGAPTFLDARWCEWLENLRCGEKELEYMYLQLVHQWWKHGWHEDRLEIEKMKRLKLESHKERAYYEFADEPCPGW